LYIEKSEKLVKNRTESEHIGTSGKGRLAVEGIDLVR